MISIQRAMNIATSAINGHLCLGIVYTNNLYEIFVVFHGGNFCKQRRLKDLEIILWFMWQTYRTSRAGFSDLQSKPHVFLDYHTTNLEKWKKQAHKFKESYDLSKDTNRDRTSWSSKAHYNTVLTIVIFLVNDLIERAIFSSRSCPIILCEKQTPLQMYRRLSRIWKKKTKNKKQEI